MEEIRIMIVDDHKMIISGIASQLNREDGISIVETLTEPKMLFDKMKERKPDALLMDIRMG